MKQYIIFFLLNVMNINSVDHSEVRRISFERQAPQWESDEQILPFILSTAALVAKNDQYYSKKYIDNDLILFKVYNQDCSFYLLFNSKNRECVIQFNAHNDEVDYNAFKRMIDFFFIDS